MDQSLIEAGVEKGDYRSVQLKLRQLGFHCLLLKEPHTRIQFSCPKRHEFHATPMQAINDGCPTCNLIDHVDNGPTETVSEADFKVAVAKQHKFLRDSLEQAKRKLRRAVPTAKYWAGG